MGADEFYVERVGKNANAAFARAREDALYESGHGGYTGTIAEVHDFRMVKFPKRATKKNFMGMVNELMDGADKFEPCFCFEFTGVMQQEAKKVHGVKKGSHDKVFAFFGLASS